MAAGASDALIGVIGLACGTGLLSRSWRKRGGWKAPLVIAGWLLIGAGLVFFCRQWGAEVGTTHGLLALSLIGYVVVAAHMELRSAQSRAPREAALEPEERPANWPRGIAKSLLAIVLSGVASIGVGVAFALSMPMPVHDRIVIGGLLVPVLWGGGMAWTLSDAKLLRATIVLVTVSVVGYAIAFLPKVFS